MLLLRKTHLDRWVGRWSEVVEGGSYEGNDPKTSDFGVGFGGEIGAI